MGGDFNTFELFSTYKKINNGMLDQMSSKDKIAQFFGPETLATGVFMYLGIAVIGVFEFAVPNIGTAPDA
jgi:hypothetical protein